MSRLARALVLLSLSIVTTGLPPAARATNVMLTFGSLPSAQGWTFVTSGASDEAGAFAAWGDSLTLHTLGDGLPPAGAFAYYEQPGVIAGNEPVVIIEWTPPATIKYYRFQQGDDVAVMPTTWGSVKAMYR